MGQITPYNTTQVYYVRLGGTCTNDIDLINGFYAAAQNNAMSIKTSTSGSDNTTEVAYGRFAGSCHDGLVDGMNCNLPREITIDGDRAGSIITQQNSLY